MTLAVLEGRLATIVLVAAVFCFTGCSDVLSPTSSSPESPLVTAVTPGMTSDTWTVVGTGKVPPGHDFVVQGSRYTLYFSKASMKKATDIVIEERNPDIIDVRFSPDGVEFDGKVTLVVDYSGSVNAAAFRDLGMSRFNTDTGSWVRLPGRDNAAAQTYTVELNGFSRYALTDAPGGGSLRDGVTDGRTPSDIGN